MCLSPTEQLITCVGSCSFQRSLRYNITVLEFIALCVCSHHERESTRTPKPALSQMAQPNKHVPVCVCHMTCTAVTCMRTSGWPSTTIKACARVIATLNRLGFLKKPTAGSAAPPRGAGLGTPPCVLRPGTRDESAGRDRTVEMKMMRASWPWKSSTVPTLTAPRSRALSNSRSFFTCRQG